MSFVLAENMDFGTVETAVYGYVNFCQGPDFYEFQMRTAGPEWSIGMPKGSVWLMFFLWKNGLERIV